MVQFSVKHFNYYYFCVLFVLLEVHSPVGLEESANGTTLLEDVTKSDAIRRRGKKRQDVPMHEMDPEAQGGIDPNLGKPNDGPIKGPVAAPTAYTPLYTRSTTVEFDLSAYGADVVCKMQPNAYECNGSKAYVAKFYYDIKMQDCKTYEFGALCKGFNKFNRLRECHDTCRDEGNSAVSMVLPPQVGCLLQPDFGHCNEYHPMWYFDVSYRTCKGFSYSGCGGNVNRFTTNQLCLSVCADAVKYIYKV